jgi:hydroxypyruvate isomerase
MKDQLNRRKAIQQISLGAGLLATGLPNLSCNAQNEEAEETPTGLKNNIKQSVCQWCFGSFPLEELAERAKDMGIKGIDLLGPDAWPVIQKYGLQCALGNDTWVSLPEGFNNPDNHANLIPKYIELIDKAADHGVPNVIVFSGNRNGLSDEEGLENCAVGLDKVVKHAEKKGVMIVSELLNSKVDHIDFQCDHTDWGVALVEKLGSPNFKLLYDIYHMQIMEGDIIATIKKNHQYIAHYHTAGVPGRNEIDETQELYYPAIIRAILETGYKGYLAQEFIPKAEDKFASLEAGVKICDV